MSAQKLSVIIPTYNHGKYLARSISAILRQSQLPYEFIILNDGSDDNTNDIVQNFVDKYPWIKYVRHSKNQGLFSSLKELHDLVTGDWVYGHASDDYVEAGFFEEAMQMAEKHPGAGIICGEMVARTVADKELYTVRSSVWDESQFISPERYRYEYLYKESPGHAMGSSTIYNVKHLADIGRFRPELGPLADMFAARTLALKYGALYLAKRCSSWCVHSESISQSTLQSKGAAEEYIDRTAELMTSREFKDYYPQSYVVHWVDSYKRMIKAYNNRFVSIVMKVWNACSKIPLLSKVFAFVAMKCKNLINREYVYTAKK